MKTPEYLTDRELEAAERLYDITDKEMQATAVGYMYGMPDKGAAERLRDELTEDEIADSYDYYLCRGLPTAAKLEMYGKLKGEREAVMEEYGLGPIDAVVKRRELENEKFSRAAEDSFTKGVESIPETLPGEMSR